MQADEPEDSGQKVSQGRAEGQGAGEAVNVGTGRVRQQARQGSPRTGRIREQAEQEGQGQAGSEPGGQSGDKRVKD